ncbi:hypothetical protein Acor_33610 [Acrocarpospora corrugata]|uniref:Uncharacterized protein n=1 Tax=Acrocarpospora corrugata TaxID=35763 RepID=A0A5M3VWR8_9ACTN|nr:hypothetical protein Acor_33610 [Acrocarpospora corrugata]
MVHPLFARLFRFLHPFNDIKPIGVGDLKVVRQWLSVYHPGEISHVHNILKGEARTRDHRRLEKTEDVFSFSDSRTQDVSKDTQSTERYEVKNETENVLKQTLNVTANLTYENKAEYHRERGRGVRVQPGGGGSCLARAELRQGCGGQGGGAGGDPGEHAAEFHQAVGDGGEEPPGLRQQRR